MKLWIPLIPIVFIEIMVIVASFQSGLYPYGRHGSVIIPFLVIASCVISFSIAVFLLLRRGVSESIAGYFGAKILSALASITATGTKGFEFLPFVILGYGVLASILGAIVLFVTNLIKPNTHE